MTKTRAPKKPVIVRLNLFVDVPEETAKFLRTQAVYYGFTTMKPFAQDLLKSLTEKDIKTLLKRAVQNEVKKEVKC